VVLKVVDTTSMRPRHTLVIFAAILLMGSCRASLHVYRGAEERYEREWSAAWSAIKRDQQPLIPTAYSPGVCNKGGDQNQCYLVGEALIRDFTQLVRSLSGDWIPDTFKDGNAKLLSATRRLIQGLQLRNYALSHGDNGAWQESQEVIRRAGQDVLAAYDAFPAIARPLPPPRV
jgi:hypothetical protein